MPRHPRKLPLLLVLGLVLIAALAAGVSAISTAGTKARPAQSAVARPLAAPSPIPKDAALISVPGNARGRTIPADFLGLSFELNAIIPYAGTDPRALNPVFEQLIRNLAPAPVLRFAGDTTDWAWVPADGLRKPTGVRVTLTPTWLRVARTLTADLRAKLILGIDLEADSRPVAAAEGRAFVRGMPSGSIEALEPGNEPELYAHFAWYVARDGTKVFGRPPGYDFTAFVRDFSSFARVLPGPLAGPTTGSPAWMALVGRFLAAEPRVRLVSLHRYPVQQCYISKSSLQYPTIAHLLNPYSSRRLADSVARFVPVAHAHHLPVRIDEMNTVSCGKAPGVSDAYVSALWALDALFQMARVGIDGVNIHSYPGAPYDLFRFSHTGGVWSGSVAPEYYGLLMFAQAMPTGSRLLAPSTRNASSIRAWATRGTDGHLRVTLINVGSRTRAVVLRTAGATATVERLRGPSLGAKHGVTLGGQSFGSRTRTGLLAGKARTERIPASSGRFVFTLPGDSAALITI